MTVAKIVYASMTGNTEGIANIIEEKLKVIGIETECLEVDDVDSDFFEAADICIVATYTYNDGEIPDEFEDFYEDLEEIDLSGKIYGVVGSGDKELYPEYFCHAAELFEDRLKKVGAKEGSTLVKINNDADSEDAEKLQRFVNELVKA